LARESGPSPLDFRTQCPTGALIADRNAKSSFMHSSTRVKRSFLEQGHEPLELECTGNGVPAAKAQGRDIEPPRPSFFVFIANFCRGFAAAKKFRSIVLPGYGPLLLGPHGPQREMPVGRKLHQARQILLRGARRGGGVRLRDSRQIGAARTVLAAGACTGRLSVWAIRVRLQIKHCKRDLAMFNLAIDSKLRGCDLVSLRVDDIAVGGQVRDRATIMQHKTGRPVQFEIRNRLEPRCKTG
jgi:hypothetical protein